MWMYEADEESPMLQKKLALSAICIVLYQRLGSNWEQIREIEMRIEDGGV